MVYNEEMGWVKEPNGPNRAYWRRIKRSSKSHSPKTLLKTSGTKQVGPILLQELDPHISDLKRVNLGHRAYKGNSRWKTNQGWRYGAQLNEYHILELLKAWNLQSIQALKDMERAEYPKPIFLIEMKAGLSWMERLKYDLDFVQGLIMPSEGNSGGFALLRKEEMNVNVETYSNSHIDAVITDPAANLVWRVISFYGHPVS